MWSIKRWGRRCASWSQAELALRVDMDRNYLSLIELGRSSPSVRMLMRLCAALDVQAADLLDDLERRVQAQTPRQG